MGDQPQYPLGESLPHGVLAAAPSPELPGSYLNSASLDMLFSGGSSGAADGGVTGMVVENPAANRSLLPGEKYDASPEYAQSNNNR